MDAELIRHIAALARIELSPEELERLAPQLESIIRYFDKLAELDTSAVAPLVHAVESANVLAADLESGSLGVEATLANAPRHDGELFRVPRVLGTGS